MIPQQTVTFGIGTDIAIVDAHRTLHGTLCPRVLVVEGNALLAIELERLLDELDCEVCTIVNTAPAALVAAAIHQPDLVLLDLCGSDAQQIAAQIHRDLAIPTLCLEDMLKLYGSMRFRSHLRRVLYDLRTGDGNQH
jgi:DNA-binding NarL/FixJ family response regulator